MSHEQAVIVGAGPAGVAAAVQCSRLGVRPLLLDRTGQAGGLVENAFLVENYPGLERPLDGRALTRRLRADLDRFELGVERAEVLRLESRAGGLSLRSDRGELSCRTVIVAVGTVPRELGISGERELAGDRLFYEVRELLQRRPEAERVLIFGGGEAACDYALTLAARGIQARMLVRASRLRAGGRLAAAVAASPLIQVSTNARCESFAAGPRVRVSLGEGATGSEDEEADAVLVAVGRRSALPSLLEEKADAGGAGVSHLPGLFLAGDARRGSLGQVGIAVGDGLSAAFELCSYLERCPC